MQNNSIRRRKVVSLIWPATLLVSGGAAALWWGLAQGGAQVLAAAVLALTAVLGIVWFSRDRAAKRLNAALEAYTSREIARAEQRKAQRRLRTDSSRKAVLQSH
jgi:hypothetical protein